MTDEPKKRWTPFGAILFALLAAVMMPVLTIGLILFENGLFGTFYLSDGLEAIGLGGVLEKIFTGLGING